MTKKIITSGIYAERDLMLKVVALTPVADGALAIDLARVDGSPMPPWEPGAHLEIDVPDIGVRHYSLCGVPQDRSHWRIAVRLADVSVANASLFFHTQVQVGDEFHVFAPRNNFRFALPGEGQRMHLVAGGIGITPMLPMAVAAEQAGLDWSLTYYGKTAASMPFLDQRAAFGDRVQVITSDNPDKARIGDLLSAAAEGDLVYSCGPSGLIADVEESSVQQGLLHRSELFSFSGGSALRDDDKSFELVCRTSGVTLEVAADETIVEAMERKALPTRTSCRIGMCGTCETRVLLGTPDHRDTLLTEDERELGETMMVCVGRAMGERLVLDL